MIDDATSQLTARFVGSDSTAENMRLLWSYLERHGRPAAVCTDKAHGLPEPHQPHSARRDGEPAARSPLETGRASPHTTSTLAPTCARTSAASARIKRGESFSPGTIR